jgi:hypothetical protein
LPAFVQIETNDRLAPVVASGQFLTIDAGDSAFDYIDIAPVSGSWEDIYFEDPRARIIDYGILQNWCTDRAEGHGETAAND